MIENQILILQLSKFSVSKQVAVIRVLPYIWSTLAWFTRFSSISFEESKELKFVTLRSL